jgi:hypothetical protein
MQAKITLMGLHEYLYDAVDNPDGLFSQLSVPASTLDKDILKNTILLRGGEFEVLYPNPDFMVPMIAVWSAKWADTITRWWTAFQADYDPISNYDRHEEWTDTASGSGSGQSSGTSGGSVEDTTSAYNVSTYSPEHKETTTGSNSGSTTSSFSNSNTHDGHLYGNIGVTTNQQMIEAEFELRKINLYNEVADLFLTEFVIPVR